MSKPETTKKSIVIVGGGHAGSALARTLSGVLNPSLCTLVLINPRPFSIWYPAMLRIVTSTKHDIEGKAFMPYDKLFKGPVGTYRQGKVTTVKRNQGGGGTVVLEDGEEVPWDILVVATGSMRDGSLNIPDNADAIKGFLEENRTKISNAKDIILVGGGSVGMEYAGEIKDIYPNTKVTIVHGGSKLLNDAYPDKVRDAAEQSLRQRGINIVLGEYIDSVPQTVTGGSVTSRSGKEFTADLILPTTGPRPDTKFLESLGQGTLTDKGYVKVNQHLQLSSFSDIFAVGDILDLAEQKQAAKVGAHGAVVSANIVSLIQGQPPKAIYKGKSENILLTNGKDGGISYFGALWGLMFGNWLTKTLKSKGLLISYARGGMGLSD